MILEALANIDLKFGNWPDLLIENFTIPTKPNKPQSNPLKEVRKTIFSLLKPDVDLSPKTHCPAGHRFPQTFLEWFINNILHNVQPTLI